MSLSLQATIIASVVALAFLGIVVELIRRHRLQERYSLLWAITGVIILGAILIPGATPTLARALGIYDTSIALLSLAVLLLLAISLHLTVVVSRLAEQNTHLAQESAMLRTEVEQMGPSHTTAPATAPPSPAAPVETVADHGATALENPPPPE